MKNFPERSSNTRFRSFSDDLDRLKQYFEKDVNFIIENSSELKIKLKTNLASEDGLTDSIKLCLNNPKFPYYRNILKNLISISF